MDKYIYEGPVMLFNNNIANKWTGSTMAPSESKAKNNLVYQFKKAHGLTPSAKINLPGKLLKGE
ncbi:MAG: hypothetical protein K9L62_02000 [Vallitaleaceae bacterium]|nr:hypothetical protein [Vallitaleaceae bacterium]